MSEIVQANQQDKDQLHVLLNKANAYSGKLSERFAWEKVEKAYSAIDQQLQLGNVFVFRGKNGSITSSIILNEMNEDWGERGHDGKALYFTKLMKDPEEAHSDEALQLLSFAADKAKQRNKSLLRCDAVSDHYGVISYYKRLGFKEQNRFLYSPTREGVLLEISVSQLL